LDFEEHNPIDLCIFGCNWDAHCYKNSLRNVGVLFFQFITSVHKLLYCNTFNKILGILFFIYFFVCFSFGICTFVVFFSELFFKLLFFFFDTSKFFYAIEFRVQLIYNFAWQKELLRMRLHLVIAHGFRCLDRNCLILLSLKHLLLFRNHKGRFGFDVYFSQFSDAVIAFW